MIIEAVIGAYGIGSIPFGKLFCRIAGVDIQQRGSGNIGYANVQRIMGWRYGLPTLLCDASKGALATYVGLQLGGVAFAFTLGMIALVGHVYPAWLRFRGGKGIATGLGIMAVIAPPLAGLAVLVYVVLTLLRSASSVASLAGVAVIAIGLPIVLPAYWWMGLICLAVPLVTLRDNLRGTVPQYG
jgi:glycerol-3-phosphate acyltransferase PlsY